MIKLENRKLIPKALMVLMRNPRALDVVLSIYTKNFLLKLVADNSTYTVHVC